MEVDFYLHAYVPCGCLLVCREPRNHMQQILRWGMLITCCSRHRVHSTPILLSTQSVHNHIPVQPISCAV